MKTKNIQAVIITLILLSVQLTVNADEFTKKMSKSYDVESNATLVLKNKFGKIQCENWDQNKITIDVEIKVEASSQEKANKYFERINVDISGSSTKVSVVTDFDNDIFNKNKNNNISVDFYIKMPASINLDVSHKFGDLIIAIVKGNSEIELAYGNMDVQRLEGNSNVIDVKFSEAEIDYVKNAELDLQYSELEIDEAGSMNAESKFSEFEIGKADVLTLESGYNDDNIGYVRDFDLDAGFSDVDVRNVQERLVAVMDYGELKVKEVDAGFSKIDVSSSYGGVDIGINPEASFKLIATVKMGDFSYPRSKARISEAELSYTSKKYEGVVGDNENPAARVMVDVKNGGANIYYR